MPGIPLFPSVPSRKVGTSPTTSADFYTQAVRAAVEKGSRNTIMVLKNPKVCFDSMDLQAFWKAAQAHGLNVEKILHIDDDRAEERPEVVLTELLTRELREWKNLPLPQAVGQYHPAGRHSHSRGLALSSA